MQRLAVCFYHSRDLDGWASAAIVQKAHPHVKLIGWTYGDPIPQLDIDAADDIFIADICFPPVVMNQIHFSGKGFIWCDHHESAINMAKEHAFSKAAGRRDENFGACELTWLEFHPDEVMPQTIEFLGAYDCFRHKEKEEWYSDKVLSFQWAARAFIRDPEGVKEMLLDSFSGMELWLTYGFGIKSYLNREALSIYKNAFPIVWHGHRMLFLNKERFNPINYGIDYHKDGYAVFGCFWFEKGKWQFSLYNDNKKVNVAVICVSEGGGGHAGAAGFVKDAEWINELFEYFTKDKGGSKG